MAKVTRPYRSALRSAQANATRERILEATIHLMAAGPASVSIPAVAREAGVSVPTVYRHFATKDDLLSAVYPYVVRRAGLDEIVLPGSLGELRSSVASVFRTLGGIDEEARAAMSSPAGEEARRVSMPQRLARSRQLLATDARHLASEDRDRIARLLTLLLTSSTFRIWHDHLGMSVEQAAEDVDWIVRAALAAAEAREA